MTDPDDIARLERRFDAIEAKLDQLVTAQADIRVLETKLIQCSESLQRAFEWLEKHDAELDKLKMNARIVAFAERFFWILATAAVGYYFYAQGGAA